MSGGAAQSRDRVLDTVRMVLEALAVGWKGDPQASLADRARATCYQVTVAGSLRRGVPMVRDAEIVLYPRLVPRQAPVTGQLWDQSKTVTVDLACEALDALADAKGWTWVKRGDKYRQLVTHVCNVDLFMVRDQRSWGYLLTLRTGGAVFSRQYVMELERRGFKGQEGLIVCKRAQDVRTAGGTVASNGSQ